MNALTPICLAIGLLTCTLAQSATVPDYHAEQEPRTTDLGPAPQDEVRSVTLSLAPKNIAAMEAYAAAVADPASPSFRTFLTPGEVRARFGQDAQSVAHITNLLQAQGLNVTKVYENGLLISATGTNAQLGAVFGSPIHVFQAAGQTWEAPLSDAAVPAQLGSLVTGIHGLNARPLAHSHAVQQRQLVPALAVPAATAPLPTPNAAATTTPGAYTTFDLARQYNITPLYQAGLTGAGKTIGIATFAGYKQSDAYAYWDALGLKVARTRITDVLVNGGANPTDGPGSENALETTMDVEQAGAVAPGARIRVYIAPNGPAGLIDLLSAPVNENLVDTLSVSWGSAESWQGRATQDALHVIFLQAAIQGISVIASSGDSGAYELNNPRSSYRYPDCSSAMSVDAPASDPLVLAAGGTTLPFSAPAANIHISQERAWGLDYQRDFVVKTYGQALYYAKLFPVGSGGGVSSAWPRPGYQGGLAGVANTAPGQMLYCKNTVLGMSGTGYQPIFAMPVNYAGRNLPDVSMNADTVTGYALVVDGRWTFNNGGTSIVAPQLNGILSLVAGGINGRLGQIHPLLYGAFKAKGYGAGSPFRAITTGNNFYYASRAGYNPATGLGSLDAANLARTLGLQF